jgi:transcription elongation factor GreA-like protein/transcription elongation GreA/GreB family factor
MAETLLSRVAQLITEEKWTRSALSNYTVGQFKETESVLDETFAHQLQHEVKEYCRQCLAESKNSLLALYLFGLLSWIENQLDDGSLAELLQIFETHSKWALLEYVSLRMLQVSENAMALTFLANVYQNQAQNELYFQTMERLARVDYEDANVTDVLAKHYDELGQHEMALSYYKKSIYRWINSKQFTKVQQVWQRLIAYGIDCEDVFTTVLLKVEKSLGMDKAAELKKQLYALIKAEQKWNLCLELIKDILHVHPKDVHMRRELIDCYRAIYHAHSRLEECLSISDLAHGFRDVNEAIAIFEKHISLDTGRFVFHRVYGVGRIRQIDKMYVVIDFVKKRQHSMDVNMAISSLLSLPDEHIWVLKSMIKRDILKEKLRKDIVWALRIFAISFNGRADIKKIKAELSPTGDLAKSALFTTSEWTDFSQRARQAIKTHPSFGNDPDNPDVYTLRTTPVSYEEKLANRFRAEEGFIAKLSLVEEFIETADVASEYFTDMLTYFNGYLKMPQVSDYVMMSYLLMQKLTRANIYTPSVHVNFIDLFNSVQNIESLYMGLDYSNYQQDFLLQVKQYVANWQDIYLQLLPVSPQNFMIDELLSVGLNSHVISIYKHIIDHYRTNTQAFFWLVKAVQDGKIVIDFINEDVIYLNLLHLLDISQRNISAKKDVVTYKRLLRLSQQYLFKAQQFLHFLQKSSLDTVMRLYSLFSDIKDIDPQIRQEIRQILSRQYPQLLSTGHDGTRTREHIVVKSNKVGPIWATLKSYNEKNSYLKNLIEIEIPKNSAEIGEAIKKGDLKENAEYIFGKERQEQLQMEVGRLQKELENVRVFDVSTLDPSMVGFGVHVVLRSLSDNKEEQYTFLGPWESAPDAHIISYLAPFAEPLMGKKVGEEVKFHINEQDYHYVIEEITSAL